MPSDHPSESNENSRLKEILSESPPELVDTIDSSGTSIARLEELDLIYRYAPVGLCVLDKDLRYRRINERLAEMNGIPAEDHIGRTLREIAPHLADQTEEQLLQVLQTGEPMIGYEISGLMAATPGLMRTWIVNALPLEMSAAKPTGINIAIQEITASKQAEEDHRENERRLSLAISATEDAIWEWNLVTGKTYYSPRWYEMLGYGVDEISMDFDGWKSLCHPDDLKAALDLIHSSLAAGSPGYAAEFRMRSKEGKWIWILGRGRVVERDADGNPVLLSGTNTDITERRKSEEALVRERNLLQAVLDSAGKAHLVYLDRDFNFVRVNGTYAATCGYRPKEMIGKNHFALYPGAEVEAIFRQVRDTGRAFEIHDRPFEFPDQPERGVTYWDWTLIPVKDAGGQVTGLILSLFETTARIRAEAAVQQERDRLSALVASIQDEVWFADVQKRFILANTAARKQFGLATDEVVDIENLAASLEVLRPDGSPRPIEEAPPLRALKGEVVANEEEIIRMPATGELRHRQVAATPVKDKDGRIIGSVSIVRDITERKRAEEKLIESEERFRTMSDGLPLIVWVHDAKGNQQFVNQTFLEFFGTTHDDMKGGRWRLLLHPDDSQEYTDEFLACTREQRFFHRQARVRNAEGEWRWIESWGRPRFTASGKYLGQVGASADITERKQAEQALRLAEKKFEQAFSRNASAMSIVHLEDGRYLEVNDTWLDLFGFRREEVLGHTSVELGIWGGIEDQDGMFEVMRSGKAFRNYEIGMRRKSGEPCTMLLSAEVMNVSGEQVIVASAVDITDRKQAEEQLYKIKENLEKQVTERTALAESRTKQLQALAIELIETEERERRQFAHLLHDDLQQMLAYAKMRLQAKVEEAPPKSTLISVAALLGECIAKSRRLSHEISPAILHQAGLMECCKWLAEKMRKQFGLNVELVFQSELSLEIMPLKIFLFRAVQELLFNIVKHSGVESAKVEVVSTEDSITVTVSDKGCGFDPEIVNSQWDKLGFGLLTIKERADYIGGVFEVKSAPGQGSDFTLTVPIAAAKSEQKAVIDDSVVDEMDISHPNRLKSNKFGIRLLLVDDHQVMREGLMELISGKPTIHVVGEASNGLEALEQARKLKPDVILMDISMPKMDGIEATRLIKAELPHTRVIGLTMHEDDQLFETMRHAGADVTLSKTTSVSELTKTILAQGDGES